jgi:hypothetical protein
MLTGCEQMRTAVAAIAGDMLGADDIHLVLPETGASSSNVGTSGAYLGCYGGPAPEVVNACCESDVIARATAGQGCDAARPSRRAR